MNVVYLEAVTGHSERCAARLRAANHRVTLTDSTSLAQVCARIDPPDLVIAALFPRGPGNAEESGISLALSAEIHNPEVATILLSDSGIFSRGELFSMLVSLRCILGRDAAEEDLVAVALHILEQVPHPAAAGRAARPRSWAIGL